VDSVQKVLIGPWFVVEKKDKKDKDHLMMNRESVYICRSML
jgi:hypothetical protein